MQALLPNGLKLAPGFEQHLQKQVQLGMQHRVILRALAPGATKAVLITEAGRVKNMLGDALKPESPSRSDMTCKVEVHAYEHVLHVTACVKVSCALARAIPTCQVDNALRIGHAI